MVRSGKDVMTTSDSQRTSEGQGRVLFSKGNGGLSKLEINSAWSQAEIYLHGAHITHFQRNNEPPVLFMSQKSKFNESTAIRGGIPVIFPWFGGREGHPAHGFARTQRWELREISPRPGGAVTVRLTLPDSPAAAEYPKFSIEYAVTVGQTLAAELTVANLSQGKDFTFENCLHTYFAIGDINAVSVTGLEGVDYLDKTENFKRKTEPTGGIKISRETDRVYLGTTGPAEIHDAAQQRKIRIDKTGSRSTVVWNPWIEKAAQMGDFGADEYKKMICVESGNVGDNRITLAPGKSATLRVEITTAPASER